MFILPLEYIFQEASLSCAGQPPLGKTTKSFIRRIFRPLHGLASIRAASVILFSNKGELNHNKWTCHSVERVMQKEALFRRARWAQTKIADRGIGHATNAQSS